MKILLTILFSFQIICSFSQTAEVEKFQNDIVNDQLMGFDGETRISTLIDSLWMEYHLKRIRNTKDKESKFKSPKGTDSLTLTESETDLIIRFFENPENLKLTANPTEFATVDTNEVIDHLERNHKNQVIFISKPLFIRDDGIGIAFFANFCCGGIYGPVNFSFYRKEKEVWTRWLDISSGEF